MHTMTVKREHNDDEGASVKRVTGRPLSSKYMSILKKRRDLPVHQQRCATPHHTTPHHSHRADT
jgi:pre-mRNA-splicing factor ATP-dependent RNA helicase DHX15/PRP43